MTTLNHQRYLWMASTDDVEHFPNNTGNDFTVSLSPEIKIPRDEDWSVAITELEISPSINTTFAICSDICEGSHVGNKRLPILRTFYPITSGSKRKHLFTFTVPYYVKLRKKNLDHIRVYITDRQGKLLSLSARTLKVTLRLRRDTPWFTS